MSKIFQTIGKNVLRADAYDKVTGRAKYAGDKKFPGLLHAKLLRSPWPHAEIVSIDTSLAEQLPGVKKVLTYKDAPQIYFTLCGHPWPADTPLDSLIFSQRLRYVGDPVAAVAALTPQIALKALSLIKVEYRELPACFTPAEALAPGAFEIHEGSGNIAGQSHYEIGQVSEAMAQADLVVEDRYKTPIIAHSPIEPHASVAEVDLRGRLTVYAATQVPSILRQRLAECLGLKISQVRVIKTQVGGGFGGKQETVYEHVNALLALALKRPVKLELSREECLTATRTRHSMEIFMRTGLTADGRLLAREIEVISNTGAYSSHGHNVVYNIASQCALLYPTPNIKFKGLTAYTNITIAGAMRGYGIPQLNFAMESHIDHMAQKLNKDPLEWRRQILYKLGEPINIDNFSVHTCGLPEVLEQGAAAIGWNQFQARPKVDGKKLKGQGLACFSYGQSCYPHSVELSGARIMMNEDGSCSLFVGSVDIGQGADTVMRQIAAEALGLNPDRVTVISGDTDICPFDVGAFASRQSYVTGAAVKKAALKCKADILERVSRKRAINSQNLDIRDGWIIDTLTEKKLLSLEEHMMASVYSIHEPQLISHEAYHYPTDNVLTFGAVFAQVEVDAATGKIDVLKLVTGLDSGRLINPLMAEGQLYGGCVMSMGMGTLEQLLVDAKSGRIFNGNLLDYKIPTFADLPEIEGFFVETEEPTSAYGNKSMGEPPNVATACAIRNAAVNATGVLMNELPLTPERVFSFLKGKERRYEDDSKTAHSS